METNRNSALNHIGHLLAGIDRKRHVFGNRETMFETKFNRKMSHASTFSHHPNFSASFVLERDVHCRIRPVTYEHGAEAGLPANA